MFDFLTYRLGRRDLVSCSRSGMSDLQCRAYVILLSEVPVPQ